MTITAIITFTAQPGQREALAEAMHAIGEKLPEVDGFEGIATYNAVDDPDSIVEIVRWESVAVHQAFRQHAAETGLFDALGAVTAGPPTLTYVEER